MAEDSLDAAEVALERPIYKLRGYLGILSDRMKPEVRANLKKKLHIVSPGWRDEPPTHVDAHYSHDGYFWVPRFFYENAIRDGCLGPHSINYQWAEGQPVTLPNLITLDPLRGQPAAVDAMERWLRAHSGGMLEAPTGMGKCLGIGTPVLMADGRVLPVEQVKTGDRLMGPDGAGRNVLATAQGHGSLFRIEPVKGEAWVCNDVHMLSLICNSKKSGKAGQIVDISLDEWRKRGPDFKHSHKLFSVGIDEFEGKHEPLPVDPYFLGVWFGDGSKSARLSKTSGLNLLTKVEISKPDPEIRELCVATAKQWNLELHETQHQRCTRFALTGGQNGGRANPLLDALRSVVGADSVIPEAVIRGAAETRRQFLAGLLDTDGYLSNNCFDFIQKREDWARAVWRIARSLGLSATIKSCEKHDQNGNGGTYFRVTISGETNAIPTRIPRRQAQPRGQIKNATRTGFSAIPIGDGDYYGFTLDGDGRFLLGDFTVTHNTITAYSIAHRFQTSIGVLVYNEHMLKNWVETAKTVFGLEAKDVGIVQRDECVLGKPVTVMMVQSLLAKEYPEELYRQIGFIVADEVHRYGAPQWNEVMRLFPARYRLGMTAEAKRPDNLGKLFFWHFGSIGHRAEMQTPKPAVTMLFYKQRYPMPTYSDWDGRLNDGDGGWIPNPVRFHKLLSNDKGRNMLIVEELCLARATGRKILIFSHFKKHLATLTKMFERAWAKRKGAPTNITLLVGGLKGAKLDAAMSGDMIFTTYSFSREALNLPHIDTLLCGTPAGNPLQPIGRLRDKGPEDRKPLLAIDIYEAVPYSKKRARARRDVYIRLKLKLSHAIRERRIPPVRKKKEQP